MERFHPVLGDSSSSSESSEDEAERPQQRRRKIVKQRNDLFNELDNIEFKRRFRIDKDTFFHLENVLVNVIEPLTNRNYTISKRNQILICLRYYATGSFQINVGDHFNVSQPTVSRIVQNISRHIASLRDQYIKMPQTEEEKRETVLKFYNIRGLPGILGALDCTHIKIQSPGGDNAEVFRNRKQWFSINTQVVGNSDLMINDIVARWPGSVHDSTIFNDSNIRARFENQEFSPYCLVGDSGYACKIYLLTPILNPRNRAEERYNRAQIGTRNTIERWFGVWKRRFPCLSVGLRVKLLTVCHIIVATAVLHNICIQMGDNVEQLEDFPIDDIIGVVRYNPADQNFATRDTLLATVFNNQQ